MRSFAGLALVLLAGVVQASKEAFANLVDSSPNKVVILDFEYAPLKNHVFLKANGHGPVPEVSSEGMQAWDLTLHYLEPRDDVPSITLEGENTACAWVKWRTPTPRKTPYLYDYSLLKVGDPAVSIDFSSELGLGKMSAKSFAKCEKCKACDTIASPDSQDVCTTTRLCLTGRSGSCGKTQTGKWTFLCAATEIHDPRFTAFYVGTERSKPTLEGAASGALTGVFNGIGEELLAPGQVGFFGLWNRILSPDEMETLWSYRKPSSTTAQATSSSAPAPTDAAQTDVSDAWVFNASWALLMAFVVALTNM